LKRWGKGDGNAGRADNHNGGFALGADPITRFSETAQLNVAYNAGLAKSDD
jgi:hypothetical protein